MQPSVASLSLTLTASSTHASSALMAAPHARSATTTRAGNKSSSRTDPRGDRGGRDEDELRDKLAPSLSTKLTRIFRGPSTGDDVRGRTASTTRSFSSSSSSTASTHRQRNRGVSAATRSTSSMTMATSPATPPQVEAHDTTMQVIDAEIVLGARKRYAAVTNHGARSYNEDRYRVITDLERFAHGLLQCHPRITTLDAAVESRMIEMFARKAEAPAIDLEQLQLTSVSAITSEFYGVFDGHGGDKCSTFLSLLFPVFLLRAPSFPADIPAAIETTCSQLNDEFHKREAEESTGSGSTALALLIRDNVAFVCNIGDCRAILISQSGVQALTTDHKAGEESERRRIEEAGGMVLYINGVPRVNGRLAVSRAFGDIELAEHVIAHPDILRYELTATDEFIVLGSDGLWDALSNEDVLSCFRSYPWLTVEEMTQLLIDRAIENGSYDNVTCIVVDLRDPDVVASEFL